MDRETQRQAAQGAHGPEKAFLGLVLAAVVVVAVAWLSGTLVALAVGATLPEFAPSAVTVLFTGGHPGIPLAAHGAVAAVLVGMCAVAGFFVIRARAKQHASRSARVKAFTAKDGWASAAAIRDGAGVKRLMQQAKELRPSLASPAPSDVGYLLGTANGTEVWASCERSFLVVGPPGSGKGLYLAVNMILDAPGPVLTTSTKPDNIKMTMQARIDRFPDDVIGIFDPQGMLSASAPFQMSWDIVAGCEKPQRAEARAEALARNSGITDGSDNAMWRGHAKDVIKGVLHAVAVHRQATGTIEGSDISVVRRFLMDSTGEGLKDAAALLRAHPDHLGCRLPTAPDNPVICMLATSLESYAAGEHRYISSVMSVVQGALQPLNSPAVIAALTPSPMRPAVTAEDLLEGSGTVYCLATARGDGAAAGFVTAFIEDVSHVARAKAARKPNGRLDPPLSLILDECANVAPLPSLPNLLADGRGQNITTVPIFQTLAQVRSGYGDDDAKTIFTASTIKIILGGSDDPGDTRDISNLIGEFDEVYSTTSRSALAPLLDMKASTSTTVRRRAIVEPSEIRSIPMGVGIVLQSQMHAYPIQLRDWRTRRDAEDLHAAKARMDTWLGEGAE